MWRLANDIIEKVKTTKHRSDDYQVDQIFILHLIGFYMISQALITSIGYSISVYYLSSSDQYGLAQSYADTSNLKVFFNYFTSLVQLIIGLTLVFKPYGWVGVFRKIRGG